MKSLKTIQIVMKVLRVLCLIGFIFCIVGAAGCFLGLISFSFLKDIEIEKGKSVAQYIIDTGNMSTNEVYTALAVGLFISLAGIALMKYNELFYKKEVDLGTPFKKEMAKKMREVGLVNIIATIAISSIAAIAVAIAEAVTKENFYFNYSVFSSILYGVFLLFLSLFADYGAELEEKMKTPEAEKVE